MDAFGGSPTSRLNKIIADIEEKYEKEFALHVDLIEIIDGKITVLGGNFTKELAIHSNIIDTNVEKISALVILEDRIDGYQYSLKPTTSKTL
jgi:hypothetical protein